MTYETAIYAVSKLKSMIIGTFGVKTEVRLFGSVARKNFSADSDIDLLVLLPMPVTSDMEEQIFDMAFDVELELGVIFGIIVHSKNDWVSSFLTQMPIHGSIEREGISI
jgi:predicted nucleotidyltransferase